MATVTTEPATFEELGQIAASGEFQRRVAYAMNNAATAIYNEDPEAKSHSARAAYAIKVANGTFTLAAAALSVMTNLKIGQDAVGGVPGNNIADEDIQNSVNALWNLLAGV